VDSVQLAAVSAAVVLIASVVSTTSLAVVYAVLVERGLTDTGIGKLVMSATFVTDLCTAVALSAIFIKPNIWFPVFLAVSLVLMIVLPRVAPWFFGRYGDRVIEPEIQLVFLCLLVLIVPASWSCLRLFPLRLQSAGSFRTPKESNGSTDASPTQRVRSTSKAQSKYDLQHGHDGRADLPGRRLPGARAHR
jgi:hypothetical protein